MLRTAPIRPNDADEPANPLEPRNPLTALLTLRCVAQLLGIPATLRDLVARLQREHVPLPDGPVSLRRALLEGSWLAIRPQSCSAPARFSRAFGAGQATAFPVDVGYRSDDLRLLARTRDPRRILAEAAMQHPNDPVRATAYADLAVTGRTSYAAFVRKPPTEAELVADVRGRLAASQQHVSDASITDGVRAVLDRAYAVAYALRGPYPQCAVARRSLGWIAVSGDDDPPHRPVNVGAAPYPQHDLDVRVEHPPGAIDRSPTSPYLPVTVRARYFVAPQPGDPGRLVPIGGVTPPTRTLPPDTAPVIPAGDRVVLFIHGHSSRAEEALGIIPFIHDEAAAQGLRCTVIAVDLPSNGYSEMIDHTRVAPSAFTSWPDEPAFDTTPYNTPLLDFLEDFLVAFVDALDRVVPVKNRFAGLVGGSLGGNIGLRLGRRDPAACPWITHVVSWSPASVWGPFAENYVKSRAPAHCAEKWSEVEDGGQPLSRWSRHNHFAEVYFNQIFGPDGRRTTNLFEAIAEAFGGSQSAAWHRPGWAWNDAVFRLSLEDRAEVYNPLFRQWHWRVAGEQLIYSHFYRVDWRDSHSPVRYSLNRARQLLIAGACDNGDLVKIWDGTNQLAALMVATPGTSLFLLDTGHSIQDERPRLLGREIARFVAGP